MSHATSEPVPVAQGIWNSDLLDLGLSFILGNNKLHAMTTGGKAQRGNGYLAKCLLSSKLVTRRLKQNRVVNSL